MKLDHNHELEVKANMMAINVRSMKSAVADLEPKDVEIVKTFSTLVEMYQMKQLLRSTFTECYYTNAMLHNMVQQEKIKKKKERSPIKYLFAIRREDSCRRGLVFDFSSTGILELIV